MRRVILSLALVGLGTGGGYLLGSLRAQPVAAAPAVRVHADPPAIVVADRGLSEADLRRVVKEELAARGGGQAGGGQELAAPAPPPANPAAFDDGMRRVNQAIAQHRWTADDAAVLDRALDTASPEQRATILHTLVPALNRGEVKLTYHGAVF